ncbi:hypothetical protein SAMN05421640_1916 [Ekhidna lutea]|uniref:Uncharacterized protein n=1 Tax=Ekhidna lutea TaxID=447679 RepID=A0A239IZR6_EKHLU|nr:hypothetical protein [Ekhidna lutea]SNS99080.1 hypothetical protein SAMN05421640_1916 [Ekhidna lutea]
MTNALLIKNEGLMYSVSFPSRTSLIDFIETDIQHTRSSFDHKVMIYEDQLDSLKKWATSKSLETMEFSPAQISA